MAEPTTPEDAIRVRLETARRGGRYVVLKIDLRYLDATAHHPDDATFRARRRTFRSHHHHDDYQHDESKRRHVIDRLEQQEVPERRRETSDFDAS